MHEFLVQKIRNLTEANVDAAMYVYMIPGSFEIYQQHIALGLHPSPTEKRALRFSELHAHASEELTKLMQEFESWSIAFPGLEVFQTALNAASYDAREAFTPLFKKLLLRLPMDPPDNAPEYVPRPIVPNPPSAAELAQLGTFVERYKWAMDNILCYVHDPTVESQNNLLSGLFEHRVSPRQPIDPSFKVISTDPAKMKELIRYFENETPWGKNKRETEASVRTDLERS